MKKVSVAKIHDSEIGEASLIGQIERIWELVRQRAFEHFMGRGGGGGNDLDDWLRAESELIQQPPAEILENDTEVILQVQAPGLEPDQIQITATPQTILIQSEIHHTHDASEGSVRRCEFAERIFRRLDLPSPIDVDKVSATLDKGMLKIVAAKAEAKEETRSIPVASTASTSA